ncbi:DUF7448 domain-containing protein [Corynebacterium glyciniphilum]|uniref:DUF7448 domain-containing protein n=1 Tax=Corynebacterium glyciniphilum TaxID=1404244 RepID=UPI003FCFC512
MKNRIYDMSLDDLKEALVGRTVTEIDTNEGTVTLDDGTEVEFEDTSDCCAWFNYELRAGNFTDNAITSVEVTENAAENEWEEDYTIHILAANKNVADLTITGDPTSGYYCHSINMNITTKESPDA